MKRRLTKLLTALSLLLCVAVGVMWWRSHLAFYSQDIGRWRQNLYLGQGGYWIQITQGRFQLWGLELTRITSLDGSAVAYDSEITIPVDVPLWPFFALTCSASVL